MASSLSRAELPAPPVLIYGCNQTLVSNTHYQVAADLYASGMAACLVLDHLQNVTIDCRDSQGTSHLISTAHLPSYVADPTALRVNGSSDFTIQNCRFQVGAGNLAPVQIQSSSGGNILRNSFETRGSIADLQINQSTSIAVVGNDFGAHLDAGFNGVGILGKSSSQLQISHNSFGGYENFSPLYAIDIDNGSQNTVAYNEIDGSFHWTQATAPIAEGVGLDDGIILRGENSDLILGNTISSVWDTGIETTGLIQNTRFMHNIIVDALIAGIGGWWGFSWHSNTVLMNHIEIRSALLPQYVAARPEMFKLFRYDSLSAGETFYLQNNQFTDNVFEPQAAATSAEVSAWVAGQFVANNNTFTRNDFGYRVGNCAPQFTTPYGTQDGWDNRFPDLILDGGGNLCAQSCNHPYNPVQCHIPPKFRMRPVGVSRRNDQ